MVSTSKVNIIVGLGMIIFALLWIIDTASYLDNSERTKGRVIDLIRSDDCHFFSFGGCYRNLIEFQIGETEEKDETGEIEYFEFLASSSSVIYEIGDEVDIAYNLNDPENIKILSFAYLWEDQVILLSLGVLFFLIGLSMRKYRINR